VVEQMVGQNVVIAFVEFVDFHGLGTPDLDAGHVSGSAPGIFDNTRVVVDARNIQLEPPRAASFDQPTVNIAAPGPDVQKSPAASPFFEHISDNVALQQPMVTRKQLIDYAELTQCINELFPRKIRPVHKFQVGTTP